MAARSGMRGSGNKAARQQGNTPLPAAESEAPGGRFQSLRHSLTHHPRGRWLFSKAPTSLCCRLFSTSIHNQTFETTSIALVLCSTPQRKNNNLCCACTLLVSYPAEMATIVLGSQWGDEGANCSIVTHTRNNSMLTGVFCFL